MTKIRRETIGLEAIDINIIPSKKSIATQLLAGLFSSSAVFIERYPSHSDLDNLVNIAIETTDKLLEKLDEE